MKARNSITFVLFFILMICAEGAYSQQESEENDVLFKRTTLLVSDMDRSLEIYRDILGFSVFNRKESGPDSFSYPVFKIPKNAKMSFATLNSPTQERTLALTEVKGIELPKPSEPMMSAIVIRVGDIDKVIAAIEALNLETTPLKTATTNQLTFKEQGFIDYDGHLIVLYQIIK